MRNEKPCSVCRVLRKRCIRLENSLLCIRCAQNGTECIPIDVYHGSDSGEPVAQDGNQELKEWVDDVAKVQGAIEEMESTLAKSVIPTITTSRTSSAFGTSHPSFSGQIKPTITLSFSNSTSNSTSSSNSIVSSSSISRAGTSTSSTASIDDSGDEYGVGYDVNKSAAKLNRIEPEWQLTIVDGHIRLESMIQTLDELEMYTQASLRYLSPFAAIFDTELIYFDSPSISIPLASISVMQRSIIKKPRKKFLTIGYSAATYDYRAVADKQLIPLYLEKYNIIAGLLHAPTFLKHYRELDDPLEDPLVLAVCVDAVAALRHNLNYTPLEKRHLADYFYTKCKDKLLDMFDDATLKFEAVITTTFLQMFLMDMVIDFAEARRLVTIALLICAELDVAYAKNEMDPVKRVIYQRHRLSLAMFNRTIDVLLEDKIDLTTSATVQLTTLEDEPETLQQYVAVSNHIFEFIGTPFVANVLKRINRLIYGQSCSLRLDDILHFEPVAREWFDSLPPEFRICKDPFARDVHKLIENNISITNFLPFSTLHMITALVTSSVLQPQQSLSSKSSGSIVTMDVMQLIRNKASSLAITSCKVLLYVMRINLERDLILPSLSFEAMSQSIYVLEKLASCAQIEFPVELRSLLQECFQTIRKRLPEDHQVPLSATRLESFLRDQKECPLDVYEQYPLPGYALLLDVYLTSIAQLDRRLLQNQYNKRK